MTTAKLITSFEGYYGQQYNPVQKGIVSQYLESFSEDERRHLFALVLKDLSTQYKTLPDVAVLERSQADARAAATAGQPGLLQIEHIPANELASDEEIEDFRRALIPVIAKWKARE